MKTKKQYEAGVWSAAATPFTVVGNVDHAKAEAKQKELKSVSEINK